MNTHAIHGDGLTLITGATGFIGRRVIRRLHTAGHRLRLFVRDPGRVPADILAAAEVVTGVINVPTDVERAVRGCERIIHLAALAAAWHRHPRTFFDVNAEGTFQLLKAARAHQVSRIVYASSCSACLIPSDRINDETSIQISTQVPTTYGRSKALAAQSVALYRQTGLDIITVYPTRVFGCAEESDANAAGVIFRDYARGRFPLVVDGGHQPANWVDVEDVAAGIVSALQGGTPGADYILGGWNATLAEIRDRIDSLMQQRHVTVSVPRRVAMGIASLEALRARVFRTKPFATPEWLESLLEPSLFDCSKAARELGYTVTPMDNSLRAIIDWAADR